MDSEQDDKAVSSPTLSEKAAIGAGGVTSGLAANTLYVNSKLRKNLSHALLATADSNLEAAATILHTIVHDSASQTDPELKHLLESLPISGADTGARMHWDLIRRAVNNPNTVLGKALESASRSIKGQDALKKINWASDAQKEYREFMARAPEAVRKGHPELEREFAKLSKAYRASIPANLEGRATLADEMVKQLPWLRKIALKDLHLTTGQKTGAGLLFAVVSGIVACGLHNYTRRTFDKPEPESVPRSR